MSINVQIPISITARELSRPNPIAVRKTEAQILSQHECMRLSSDGVMLL